MRPMRLGLWTAVLSVVFVLAGYTVFWFLIAGRIEDGVGEWAQSLRDENLDLTWHSLRVGGFPLAFRVEAKEARLRRTASGGGELQVPSLSAVTRPWDFHGWRLTALDGLTASGGAEDARGATLTARSATGSVAPGSDGSTRIRLTLARPVVQFGVHIAAKEADIRLTLPPQAPQSHTAAALGVALTAHEVSLPAAPTPLNHPLDEISIGVTLKGAPPPGPLRQAAAAWRDAGGTLDLDHLALRWGSLAIRGSGTVALDRDLQPEGAFSGAIEGYDQLMAALVASGRMRAGDATLARLALGMLAKAGPDGRPEIATSFTIQDGEMFLGPVKLGPAPRIPWQ